MKTRETLKITKQPIKIDDGGSIFLNGTKIGEMMFQMIDEPVEMIDSFYYMADFYFPETYSWTKATRHVISRLTENYRLSESKLVGAK